VGVADIDRAVGGDGCAVRAVECGGAGRTAVPPGALPAAAGDRGDGSGAQVHAADRVFFGIDDQQVALAVDRQLLRRVEGSGEGRPAVAAISPLPGAGYRRNDPAVRVDGPQRAALPLEDVNGPVGRDFDGAGAVNPGSRRRTAVAAVIGLASTGEGPNDLRGEIDDPHAVIRDVGDVEPGLRGVERQAVRLDHPGTRGWSVIAAEPGRAAAGEGRDDARAAVDPPNTMIMRVRNIDVSGVVDRDAVGLVEAAAGGRTAIPGIAGLAAAGAGRDHARARIDAPNAVVERVGKIEVAEWVEPDVERAVQSRPRRRPAIAGIAFLT